MNIMKSVFRPDFKKGDGLVTVVVQDKDTKQVLMVAYTDEDGFGETLQTGEGVFWSRSRMGRWKKGETSGHTLKVYEVHIDCDNDALLYLVTPNGPTCHTTAKSCFYRHVVASIPLDPAPKEMPSDKDEMMVHSRIARGCEFHNAHVLLKQEG